MDFNRQIGGSASFLLLILGNVITVTGVNMTAAVNLECTNDYEKYMFCQFEAQNCLYYNLTLLSNDGYGKNSCIFQTCAAGCCCSVEMILVTGETHTATVWKAGRLIESQTININNSIKPKTPKILSVKETNGNFQVRWTTNMNSSIRHTLTAQVTYYKKGDTQKVTENSTSCPINGESSYEISGRRLEPSTTYVVSVKSYTLWSNRFSDSSKEEEFTTAQNCLYYNLTLLSNDGYGNKSCIIQTCAAGCCCSVEMILVTGETHTAKVWKAGRLIESQTININNSRAAV